MSDECTGFALQEAGAKLCETYTSVGATGDGQSSMKCYMKQGYIYKPKTFCNYKNAWYSSLLLAQDACSADSTCTGVMNLYCRDLRLDSKTGKDGLDAFTTCSGNLVPSNLNDGSSSCSWLKV